MSDALARARALAQDVQTFTKMMGLRFDEPSHTYTVAHPFDATKGRVFYPSRSDILTDYHILWNGHDPKALERGSRVDRAIGHYLDDPYGARIEGYLGEVLLEEHGYLLAFQKWLDETGIEIAAHHLKVLSKLSAGELDLLGCDTSRTPELSIIDVKSATLTSSPNRKHTGLQQAFYLLGLAPFVPEMIADWTKTMERWPIGTGYVVLRPNGEYEYHAFTMQETIAHYIHALGLVNLTYWLRTRTYFQPFYDGYWRTWRRRSARR